MRLVLLPVTSIYDHTHVLMTYDFSPKERDIITKEYPMSAYCDNIDHAGSLTTLCNTVRKDKVLRGLLNLPLDDDELLKLGPPADLIDTPIKKPILIEKPDSTVGADLVTDPPHDTNQSSVQADQNVSSNTNQTTDPPDRSVVLNKMIEQVLVAKNRLMFVSSAVVSDIILCGLLVDHKSSFYLNNCDDQSPHLTCEKPENQSISLSSAQVNDDSLCTHRGSHKKLSSPTITRHDRYYLWVCLRDLEEKLIALNQNVRDPAFNEALTKIEQWIQSFVLSQKQNRFNAPPIVSVHTDNFKNAFMPSNKRQGFLLKGPQNVSNIDIPMLKNGYRSLVWDLMEQKQEILFPHPCHGRIPNFRGKEAAAENLAALSTFKSSRVVKINPNIAQEHIRFLTLASSKTLITPSLGLQQVTPFYKIDPSFLSRKQIQRAATKSGAQILGSMVSLPGIGNLDIHLVVVGSVVVNPITGARVGNGYGLSDLEYAIMAECKAVDDKRTVVATVVHESQLINDLPDRVMEPHDLAVNLVATPKRVIFTRCSFEKPNQIFWAEISQEMMKSMPVLKDLRSRVEHLRRETECYAKAKISDMGDGAECNFSAAVYDKHHFVLRGDRKCNPIAHMHQPAPSMMH